MPTEIWCAMITGICSVVAVVITNSVSKNKILTRIQTHDAVIDEKIDTLKHEVEKHNSVIDRTYNLETKVAVIEAKLGGLHEENN